MTEQEIHGESAQEAGSRTPFSVEDYFLPAWRERKRILIVTGIVTIVTLLLNFFVLPKYYKSTAILLPETEKGRLGSLGQFAGLASMVGVSLPDGDVSRLYPVIATSETVLKSVIEKRYESERFGQPVNLIEYFKLEEETPAKDMEEALKEISSLLTASYDNRTRTVTLTLEMREPQVAADVLNAILDEIDRFMREKQTTSASEQARWISGRLEEVESELRSAENSLKNFREKNRRVLDSPDLVLRLARLEREVTVKSTVYIELKKQYELAKIEEIKNVTVVNVLDRGRAPVKKERPKRAINTGLAFLISLAGMSAFYALKPRYEERVRDLIGHLGVGRKGGAGGTSA
jgi:uncharacterized protein involved in exopolysaccharide biosynthesis